MKAVDCARIGLAVVVGMGGAVASGQVHREGVPLSVRQAQARQRLIESAPPMGAPSHPVLTQPIVEGVSEGLGLPIGLEGSGQPPIPPLSPLSKGTYVNYDSPPVKSLALSTAGDRLYVVDTPNNWLTILGAPTFAGGGALGLIKHVPVGLEPVSVAVQPGQTPDSSDLFVWTANFMSDDLSVVNAQTGQVEAVVPVGDEPVSIVFDATGQFAFVVTQGPSLAMLDGPSLDARGALSVIDTALRQVVFSTAIDANTPRSMVIDHQRRRLIIAPVHSGNDTTVVGTPVVMTFVNGTALTFSTLHVAKTFSLTAGVFNASTELAPWPDVSAVQGEPSPDVNRVIRSRAGPWQQIVSLLAPGGVLSPQVVTQFATEFGCTNAQDVLEAVVSDQPTRVDRDLFVYDISQPASPLLVAAYPRMGTTITGMAAHPIRPFVLFSNLEPRNTVRLEPNLRGAFMTHEIRHLNLGPLGALATNPSPVRFNLHAAIPGFDDATAPNAAAQARSLANPVDVVYSDAGNAAYVAALGVDRVGVIDPESGEVLSVTDVDRGPRALALNGQGGLLYCYCRTDHSVVMIDVTTDTPTVVQRFALFTPEAAVLSEGRHFLYTVKVSNNFSSSCAMCHIDGNLDHLAWDLGDNTATSMLPAPTSVAPLRNHPVKGPMVTQSLRGLEKHNAFHWRGDKPEFVDFNSAFDGLLGGTQISDSDMGRYDIYVKSLVYGPNPFFRRNNAFVSPVALAGAATFASSCNPCHNFSNDGTVRFAGAPDDVAIPLANLSAQIQEIAQLRGLYKKANSDRYNAFGLLHDGRTTRDGTPNAMENFLLTFFPFIPPVDRTNMVETLLSFPGNSMAVVGWQRLALPGMSDLELASLVSDVQQMAAGANALPRHCDVVARGFVNGKDAGFVLVINVDSPNLPVDLPFATDDGSQTTLSQMLANVATGGSLTFMAVPPGSGHRIGVDVDNDGFLNSGLGEVLSANSPDYNRDGFISPDDLDEFITDFFNDPPSPHADFNQDGFISPDDLDTFITEFFRF